MKLGKNTRAVLCIYAACEGAGWNQVGEFVGPYDGPYIGHLQNDVVKIKSLTYDEAANPLVSVFADCNFIAGPGIGATAGVLSAGSYYSADLKTKAHVGDSLQSLRIPPGLAVTLYANDGFAGMSYTFKGPT
jgi:hypothetical protein